jgi:hypothetical protein
MKRTNENLDSLIERVTGEIRGESIDSSVVDAASRRVWAKLGESDPGRTKSRPVTEIRGCADFQALMPAYLTGSLSQARALLLEDHTHECVSCRKALNEIRSGKPAPVLAREHSGSGARTWKWQVAAAVIIGIGVTSLMIAKFSRSTSTLRGIVQTLNGPVYLVSDTGMREVNQGDEIKAGERIRTTRDGGAVVQLPDGSLVEMRERCEFSLSDRSDGIAIDLERGNVIVQAAKQRSRHLYVETNDCLVSVTGTIFSVNSGTKGSRVSVIEGQVQVDHGGNKESLSPGDQVATSPSIERIPVKDEIAWSRDADKYNRLLTELASLRKDLDERVTRPGVRYSTRLLDLVPEETVLYVAIPNLSAMLNESNRIIGERMQENEVLRDWWNKEQPSGLGQIMDKIREFGGYIGDEIVVSAAVDGDSPVVLAELRDPAGFHTYLDQQIGQIGLLGGGSAKGLVRVIADPAGEIVAQSAGEARVYVWINEGFFAAAPELGSLKKLAAAVAAPGSNRFKQSSLYARIADVYRDGAGLIVAADLERIVASSRAGADPAASRLGVSNLKHFIFEMKEKEGKPQNQAVLTFNEGRKGISGWLAEPGPMGALEFISPDANIVAAFVVEEPIGLVDDLLNAISTIDPDVRKHLSEFQTTTGIDIRADFAAPLGGEFAFAVDGPVLPKPSWKMVLEVYDPVHLQQTYERLVEHLNRVAAKEGKAGFQWERSEMGGLTYYTLKSLDLGAELSYTYVNGYLIAAPSRALVDRAVRYRENGYTLLNSPRFVAALPEDKNANFSALFYQNLAPVLGPLARKMGDVAGKLGEDKQLEASLLSGITPVLAYAYARGDHILFSVNGENGPLGLSPSTVLGMPGVFGLHHVLDEAMR